MPNTISKAIHFIPTLRNPLVIQRNVINPALFNSNMQCKQMYDDLIHNAEKYGLPVKLLRRVSRDYSIGFGDSSVVNATLNTMTLEEEDLSSASQMSPTWPIDVSSGLRTIYEEATHAYLDIISDEPRFSRFIEKGEQHYKGALTTKSKVTTDPMRVFQEAAGGYVGHRVFSWWLTFELLSIYVSKAIVNEAFAARLKEKNLISKLRDDYNKKMAEVVFGYSDEGGFLGIGSEQAYTTRAMSGEMKAFLDHELLEDKIPDRFEAVAGFQQLLGKV